MFRLSPIHFIIHTYRQTHRRREAVTTIYCYTCVGLIEKRRTNQHQLSDSVFRHKMLSYSSTCSSSPWDRLERKIQGFHRHDKASSLPHLVMSIIIIGLIVLAMINIRRLFVMIRRVSIDTGGMIVIIIVDFFVMIDLRMMTRGQTQTMWIQQTLHHRDVSIDQSYRTMLTFNSL
jgi:hypothetical protein